MALPQVTIVGRPNVGKSSLFNWLAGRRIAIVEPTAGVTRDRLTFPIQTEKRTFELVDTGGMGVQDVDQLTEHIEHQIRLAINQADVILFVLDVRDGVAPLDELVAERLRPIDKPVLCIVNKCDHPELLPHANDFFRLGYGNPICISAQNKFGKKELLTGIEKVLPEESAVESLDVSLKLAIVGRRNTGKSTFINALAESERMIVSEVAGTTRDSVDVRFERDGKVYVAIDTAGVRKKKSLANDIEFYSMARAERSIRRADVVMHFHDPRWTVSQVDKKLASYIETHNKPAIFVINKWDLVKQQLTTGEFADYLKKLYPGLDHVPCAFITAKDGKNVQTVLNLAQNIHKQALIRVETSELNRVVRDALEMRPPPVRYNRRPKIYFATQPAVTPPTIVLFTNGPELFDPPWLRYMMKVFRERLPFKEIPINLVLRERHGDGKGADAKTQAMMDAIGDTDLTEQELPQNQEAPKKKEPPKKSKGKGKAKPGQPKLWQDL